MDGAEHETPNLSTDEVVASLPLSGVTLLREQLLEVLSKQQQELASQIEQSVEFFGQNHIVFRPRELTELERILRDETTTFDNDVGIGSLPDSAEPQRLSTPRNHIAASGPETVVAPDKILATIVPEASTQDDHNDDHCQKKSEELLSCSTPAVKTSGSAAEVSDRSDRIVSSRFSSRRQLEDEGFREQVQQARKTLQLRVAAARVSSKEGSPDLAQEMEAYSRSSSEMRKSYLPATRLPRLWTCSRDFRAEDIVRHVAFESISAFMIILSAVMMGLEVEVSTFQERAPTSVEVLNNWCTAYFMLELAIRIIVLRRQFLSGDNCFWNGMDSFFVGVSIVELLMESLSDADLTLIRILKMVRIIRVFRIFRVWRGLWDFSLIIVHSMKSLMLALILLFLVIYVIAVALTMNSTNWLRAHIDTASGSEWGSQYRGSTVFGVAKVYEDFGSIPRSSYTLLQAVLGGVGWGEVTSSIMHVGALSTTILFAYILFIMLAVLNIITGVFVEEAVKKQQTQKDFMVEQEMNARKLYGDQLLQFFDTIDADLSGSITFAEICAVMEDEQLAAYLRVLGFEINEARRLFRLMDSDASGSIVLDEFVDGAVKLKGVAQSIDVFEILSEVKGLRRQLRQLADPQSTPVEKSCFAERQCSGPLNLVTCSATSRDDSGHREVTAEI